MLLTIFHSANTKSKFAESPFGDKTFIFESVNCSDIRQIFDTLVSYFCLNLPLDIKKPIRTKRRKSDLDSFFVNTLEYIFLDIDISSRVNREFVLDYFREYKCIFGESRSCDNLENFNIKGVLAVDNLKLEDVKVLIAKFQNDLREYCSINEDSIRKSNYTAPILKSKILYENLNGNLAIKTNGKVTDFIKKIEKPKDLKLESDNTMDLCLETFRNLGYIIKDSLPNGAIEFEKDQDSRYFWFKDNPYIMHHLDRAKSINVFNIVKEKESPDINYDDFFKPELNTSAKIIHFNEKIISVEGKEPAIESFLFKKNGMLTIKSPMGTGKSNLIKYIINESLERDYRVLVITNRVSLAHEFHEKYKLKLYLNNDYEIGDSIITQLDSLYKYNIKYFDIVILDEFTSLFLYSRTPKSKNTLSIIKFLSCLNKKVVIADAFLTGYEDQLIPRTSNIVKFINDYKDPTNLFRVPDIKTFFSLVLEKSKESKKIGYSTSVSVVSSRILKTLELFLTENNLKVRALDKDTPNITKSLIYRQFSKLKPDWDVLLYSPTVTVGVNNMNLVENHFHYDSSRATDTISSLQMIKRSRKAENIYYLVEPRRNKTCLNFNTLRDSYLSVVDNVSSESSYIYNVNSDGEYCLSPLGSTVIKIDLFKNILGYDRLKMFEYFLNHNFTNPPEALESLDSNLDIKTLIEKVQNQDPEEEISKRIDDFFDVVGFSFTINDNTEKSKFFKALDFLHNKTNLVLTSITHQEIFRDLFFTYTKNRNLFEEIFFFKELEFNYPKSVIQTKLADSIVQDDKKKILFYNLLLKNNIKLNYSYSKTNDTKFLELAGFHINQGKYKIKDYILKFKDYIL